MSNTVSWFHRIFRENIFVLMSQCRKVPLNAIPILRNHFSSYQRFASKKLLEVISRNYFERDCVLKYFSSVYCTVDSLVIIKLQVDFTNFFFQNFQFYWILRNFSSNCSPQSYKFKSFSCIKSTGNTNLISCVSANFISRDDRIGLWKRPWLLLFTYIIWNFINFTK